MPSLSTIHDQLRTAIDTKCTPVPPCRGVVVFGARLCADLRVHDTATLRAMGDRRVCPAMIQVIAWVEHSGLSHHAPCSLRRCHRDLDRRAAPRRFAGDLTGPAVNTAFPLHAVPRAHRPRNARAPRSDGCPPDPALSSRQATPAVRTLWLFLATPIRHAARLLDAHVSTFSFTRARSRGQQTGALLPESAPGTQGSDEEVIDRAAGLQTDSNAT